jgi:hypothetical protein
MVLSKSAIDFQILIREEYNKLIQKRRNYYMTIYEKLVKTKKDDPVAKRFIKLINEDICSLELLTLAYKLSNN